MSLPIKGVTVCTKNIYSRVESVGFFEKFVQCSALCKQ